MTDKQAVDLSGITGQLSDWWGSLPDEVKANLIRGAAGAGGGALLGGLAGGRSKAGLNPALIGALLGGGAAVAAPYGMRMLSGDIRFGKKPGKGIADRLSDSTIGLIGKHPGALLGTGAGLYAGRELMPSLRNAERAYKGQKVNISDEELARLEELSKSTRRMKHPFTAAFGGVSSQNRKARASLVEALRGLIRGGSVRDKARNFAAGMSSAGGHTWKGLRNLPSATYRYARGGTITPPLRELLQSTRNMRGARFMRSPGAAIGTALTAPIIGSLIDRYAFGRND